MGTTADDNKGTYIYVAEEGLGKDAQIGVYSVNNYKPGATFARTVAEKSSASTGAVNLARFSNDRDSSLSGTAGSGNAVIWSKFVPVKIIIKQDAVAADRWYTLQIQSASTGSRMRVPIKVAANATEGSIITMQPAGLKGYVSCIADGSAYGYTLSDPKYVNTPDTSATGGGTALGDDTDALEDSTSFLCAMTVNSTNSYRGNIKTDSGVRELTFTSTWKSPDSTTKLIDMSSVTNTIKTS